MKTKVYPVRQAVWGADHCYTYYFRNKEERDHYMSNHDYCNALRARTMEMEEHEFYYIAGTYEKTIIGGINVYPYHNSIKKRIQNGELIDHYFTDSYPLIGEALVQC